MNAGLVSDSVRGEGTAHASSPLVMPERTSAAIWIPLASVSCWWIFLGFIPGALKSDHFFVGGVVLALALSGPRPRILLRFLTPAFLTIGIYDAMRHFSDRLRAAVIRVQEPYLFDRLHFGIRHDGRILTPNEWWQLHTHWLLDLYSGFFYIAFVGLFIGMALYFRFRLPLCHRVRAESLPWGFFWLNLLGYSTYYWYPAAPPWYVAAHGLGPADLSVGPNPAGAIRFDELTGTSLFQEMYSRSADVFGAIPSLHVAYPLLALLYAFEFSSLRGFALTFYLSMCFAAVYLNHHYVLDILWGSAYTLVVYTIMKARGSAPTRMRQKHFPESEAIPQ